MAKPDPKAPVTNERLDDAVDSIMQVLDKILDKLAKHDRRFDDLEAGQREIRQQVSDLKVDTPTQKEFDRLRARVDRYHPPAH